MNSALDILTLLFFVIAVVVYLRLRSVLGRRTGNERPYDQYSASEADEKAVHDNVVTMKGEPLPAEEELDDETFAKRLKEIAPDNADLAGKLQEVAQADRSFDPKHFLDGAKAAYEMIVTAFASGERKQLKSLLSREVYDSFASAITEREKNGDTIEFNFVGISSADILDAELTDKTVQITIKFVSELISATRNRGGEIVEGSMSQIREVTDIWTFARDTSSRDPNWKLVATGAEA
ncbi:MAG: Tim44/TimA family putative adaptor protein [Alphaproteobacteria bacterium]